MAAGAAPKIVFAGRPAAERTTNARASGRALLLHDSFIDDLGIKDLRHFLSSCQILQHPGEPSCLAAAVKFLKEPVRSAPGL